MIYSTMNLLALRSQNNTSVELGRNLYSNSSETSYKFGRLIQGKAGSINLGDVFDEDISGYYNAGYINRVSSSHIHVNHSGINTDELMSINEEFSGPIGFNGGDAKVASGLKYGFFLGTPTGKIKRLAQLDDYYKYGHIDDGVSCYIPSNSCYVTVYN